MPSRLAHAVMRIPARKDSFTALISAVKQARHGPRNHRPLRRMISHEFCQKWPPDNALSTSGRPPIRFESSFSIQAGGPAGSLLFGV